MQLPLKTDPDSALLSCLCSPHEKQLPYADSFKHFSQELDTLMCVTDFLYKWGKEIYTSYWSGSLFLGLDYDDQPGHVCCWKIRKKSAKLHLYRGKSMQFYHTTTQHLLRFIPYLTYFCLQTLWLKPQTNCSFSVKYIFTSTKGIMVQGDMLKLFWAI